MQILLSLEQLSFPLPPFCGAHGFGHNKGETKRVKLSSLPLSCATGFFFFFFLFFPLNANTPPCSAPRPPELFF